MIDRHAGAPAESAMHELLLDSPDITAFLNQFTERMAATLATDHEEVWCAVTLLRERRPATVASSNERAAALDEIQYVFGDGPCLTAAREHIVVHVPDVATDRRWPGYTEAATAAGIASVLGVPFELAGEARAALNIYADQPHAHDRDAIEAARREVALASSTLRLAVRLAAHRETEGDLVAALESRTTIDLAAGIVMAQNRCTQQDAVQILKAASDHRNVKLRELAAELVATVGGGPATTHFEA